MSILDDEDVLVNNIENDIKFTEYWWLIKLNSIKFLDEIFTYKRMMHYDIYKLVNDGVVYKGNECIFKVNAGWYFDDEYRILPSYVDNKLCDVGIYNFREETKETAENILQLTDEYCPRVICFDFYENKYYKKYIHIIEDVFKEYEIKKYKMVKKQFRVVIML